MLDLLRDTLRSLRAHTLRYALTSLGIVWGAFMLTYLSATMEGTDQHFVRAMQKAGPKVVFMGGGSIQKKRIGQRGARGVKLEGEDVDRLPSLELVENASPSLDLWSEIVRAGRVTKLVHVQGVNERAEQIRNFRTAQGRFLSRHDVEHNARVAYLGAETAERLFGRRPPVGRRIRIGGAGFRVVGVAEAKGEQLINSVNPDDRKILVPYTAAQRWLTKDDRVGEIIFAPTTRQLSWDAIRRVRQLLAPHHDFPAGSETALWFFNIHEALSMVEGLLLALRLFLTVAGITTLLVGAVGVMNIMLVVVNERTNEIGLRKAVGATGRAIFVQFLAESSAVCLLSGLLGGALGVGLAQLIAAVLPPDSPMSSVPVLDPATLLTITTALVLVGIVAGLVPAIRASRVPPAEALRAL